MKRVCHISPVHDMADNRIFYRECQSLANAGYEVSWVVQHDADEKIDGVQVVHLKQVNSLWRRWLVTNWDAFSKALSTKSDVCHFHDPEFIPAALILRLLGKKVVYDIHEDYVSAISQKFYIPAPFRVVLSKAFGLFETLAGRSFHQIIAERYYAERFPNATMVLNYPRITEESTCQRSESNLLYTGKVHLYRGAMTHAKIPQLVPGTRVSFVGRCDEKLHRQILEANEPHSDSLSFNGVGENVPFEDIVDCYRSGSWLAGLAIFDPNEHLQKKELTKLFEYMSYGLPIIASNFPAWRRLVEENACGICVDPSDENAVASAVKKLRDDPALWQEMSENGMRVVREKYTWKSQEANLLRLYDDLFR